MARGSEQKGGNGEWTYGVPLGRDKSYDFHRGKIKTSRSTSILTGGPAGRGGTRCGTGTATIPHLPGGREKFGTTEQRVRLFRAGSRPFQGLIVFSHL